MKINRIIAVLLLAATLTLVACQPRIPTTQDTQTADPGESETREPDDTQPPKEEVPANGLTSGLQIVSDKRSDYKILIGVSPSGEDTLVAEAASALRDVIYEMTGVRLRLSQATSSNIGEKEIIVGSTCRETDGIYTIDYTSLGSNGYQIKTIDERIVISCTSDDSYWAAIYTFCREFLGYDAYTMPTIPECSFLYVNPRIDYLVTDASTGRIEPISIKIDGVDISEYIILAGKGFASAGQILSSAAKKIQNVSVNVYNDETTKKMQDREIIIGTTSREGNQFEIDLSDLADDECRIQMIGTRLVISAKSYEVAKAGISNFLEDYFDYTSKYTYNSFPTEDIDVKLDAPISYFTQTKSEDKYFFYTEQGNVDYDALLIDSVSSLLVTSSASTPCFSDERVITLMLNKAKASLRNSDYNISYVSSAARCQCDACRKANEEEGTPYGAYYRAVAKIADTLYQDPAYNRHELIVSAYQDSLQMPQKVTFTPNVRVVVCNRQLCSAHGIDDEACEINASFAEVVKTWCERHENVYVLDFTSDYYYHPATFPNLFAVKENMAFYASQGVEGVYLVWDEKQTVGEFSALRSELNVRLFADPYMSDEDYDKAIETVLKNLYGGENGVKIKQYYDLFASAANDHCYTVFSMPNEVLSAYDIVDGEVVYKMELMCEMYRLWAQIHPYYSVLSHSKVYLAQMLFSRYQREPEAYAYVQFAYWLVDAVQHGDLSGVTDRLFDYADSFVG